MCWMWWLSWALLRRCRRMSNLSGCEQQPAHVLLGSGGSTQQQQQLQQQQQQQRWQHWQRRQSGGTHAHSVPEACALTLPYCARCLQVASLALRAILPAWAAAGKSLQELAAAVVAALPRVSPHRRLSLLAALVAALPQVGALRSAHTALPGCRH